MNDFAHVIDPQFAAAIETYCGNVERATGAQFAIVTVDSLEDEPVEDVAVRLFKEWGIGKKGTDEGLLLLLAIKDHKNRIEVGYGLEPIIPDGSPGACCAASGRSCGRETTAERCWPRRSNSASASRKPKGVTIEGQPPPRRRSGDPNGGGIVRDHHRLRHS